MKRLLIFLSVYFFVSILNACINKPGNATTVSFHLYPAQNTKIFVCKIPFQHEKLLIVDSAILKNPEDSFVFKIPKEKDRMYYVEEDEYYNRFYFIPDTSDIIIQANMLNSKCKIKGSNASISYNNFEIEQSDLAATGRNYFTQLKNINSRSDKTLMDSLKKKIEANISVLNKHYINYADTVTNPAAFLAAYTNIDFGNNYEQLKKFINSAAMRFKSYQSVQNLKQQVLAYISIYEQEFNIGDVLPAIQLPDYNGRLFSTTSLKGKYYLINFWASWCPLCLVYNKYQKQLQQNISSDSLTIVSVALDDNIQSCKNIISTNNYNWIQLIDTGMWQGVAANTLKFDSIPFNFLVAPDGKILAKAIKPDSLFTFISNRLR